MKKILIIIGVVIIIFSMAKIKDLSPKFKIPLAEKELELQMGQVPMGMNQGGLNMYSNKFKRGYGNAVFGSDENGIWLGGAEFDDSPFNVDMDGALAAKSATFKDEDNTTIIDAGGLVSTASFPFDSVAGSSTQVTNSTSYVDVSGLTLEITLEREARILIIATVRGLIGGAPDDNTSRFFAATINRNGAIRPPIVLSGIKYGDVGGYTTIYQTQTTHYVESLAAGTHTIKLQFRTSNGSYNATIKRDDTRLSYIVLGK